MPRFFLSPAVYLRMHGRFFGTPHIISCGVQYPEACFGLDEGRWRRDYQSRGLRVTKLMPRGTDSPASILIKFSGACSGDLYSLWVQYPKLVIIGREPVERLRLGWGKDHGEVAMAPGTDQLERGRPRPRGVWSMPCCFPGIFTSCGSNARNFRGSYSKVGQAFGGVA